MMMILHFSYEPLGTFMVQNLKSNHKISFKDIFGPEKDHCFFGSQKNRYPRKAYRGSQPPQVCISLKLGKLNYCQRPWVLHLLMEEEKEDLGTLEEGPKLVLNDQEEPRLQD